MKKNQKILIWVGVGVATAVGGYFLYRHFTKPSETAREVSDSDDEEDEDIPTAPTKSTFPLKKGSRGEEVKVLQQYLNRSPMCKRKMPKPSATTRVAKILPLDEDGIFGDLTLSALKICYDRDSVDEKLWERMSDALPTLSVT